MNLKTGWVMTALIVLASLDLWTHDAARENSATEVIMKKMANTPA